MKQYRKTFLAVLIFLGLQFLASMLGAALQGLGMNATTALSLSLIISGIATVILLAYLGIVRLKVLRPTHMKWRLSPLAVAGAFMGIFAMNLISELLPLPDLMKIDVTAMAYNPLGIISITLIAPIVEEMVFREGIISSLLRHDFHRWQAILVSALAFSIVHLNPAQMPFAFIMGIILGIIFAKTGNIVTTAFIHIVNNTLAIIQLRVFVDKGNEVSFTETLGGPLITAFFILVSSLICVLCLHDFWKKYHRGHRLRRRSSDSGGDSSSNPFNNYNKYGLFHK